LDQVRQDVAQMREVGNQAYEVVRNMLAASLPTSSIDFAAALLIQAKATGERAGFQVQLKHQGQPRQLTALVQQQLLYLLREALVNVQKHADARYVNIDLAWTDSNLTVTLVDDGRGFPPDVPPLEGHFGLAIMHQRARGINGYLSLTSDEGQGTQLVVSLPLAPPNPPTIS